jgi:DNA-binding ferritin-like protein (Dps family)
MTAQYVSVRAHIMDLLGQVEDLLQEAECDGRQLAELDCYTDVNEALSTLVQTVDYYVD